MKATRFAGGPLEEAGAVADIVVHTRPANVET